MRHRQGLRHSARYCLYCNGVDPGSDTDDLTDEDEGTVFENTAENTSARDARHSQGGVSECGFQPESATPRHERVSGKRSMNARELLAVDASMDPRRSSTNYGRDDLHRRSAAATPHLPNSSRIRNMPDQVQPSHGDPPPPVPYPSATQVPYPSTFQVPYPGTSANASHHQQTFAIANPRKRTPSPTSIRADPVNGTNNDKVIASRRLYQIRRNGSKAHMQRAVTEAVLRSGESDETWCNAIVRLDSARLHVLYSNMESGGIGDGARALLERATIEEKEIADLRKIAHEEEEDGVWDDGMMDEVLRAVLRLIVK